MRSVKVHNKGVNAIYKLKCPLNANIFTTEHTWFTIPSTPCNMSCTNNYIRIHRAVQFSVRDRTGPDRGRTWIGPDRSSSVQSSVRTFGAFWSSVRSRVGPKDWWTGPMDHKNELLFLFWTSWQWHGHAIRHGTIVPHFCQAERFFPLFQFYWFCLLVLDFLSTLSVPRCWPLASHCPWPCRLARSPLRPSGAQPVSRHYPYHHRLDYSLVSSLRLLKDPKEGSLYIVSRSASCRSFAAMTCVCRRSSWSARHLAHLIGLVG